MNTTVAVSSETLKKIEEIVKYIQPTPTKKGIIEQAIREYLEKIQKNTSV